MLTYADVCRRALTYADVCRRMPTYAVRIQVVYLWLGAHPSIAFSDKQEGVLSGGSTGLLESLRSRAAAAALLPSLGPAGGLQVLLWRNGQELGLALSIRCLQMDNLSASAACPVP